MCKYCQSLAPATGTVCGAVAPGNGALRLPTVVDNYTPCQNSPYAALPDKLRKTLGDTFTAIEAGTKDSEGHAPTDAGQLGLQGTAKGQRTDTWDALDNIPSSLINVYRLIYDRVQSLIPSLWDQILWIRWSWISSSMGFGVTYQGPAPARTCLTTAASSSNANQRQVCFENRTLSAYFHKDCDCWRELPKNTADAQKDPAGLHMLVGDRPQNQANGDSIHIDPIDPYKFSDPDGDCKVSLNSDTWEHLKQVFFAHNIVSPFQELPRLLPGVQKDLENPKAFQLASAKSDVADIAASWAKEERSQAVLGQAGWDYFQPKVDKLRSVADQLELLLTRTGL